MTPELSSMFDALTNVSRMTSPQLVVKLNHRFSSVARRYPAVTRWIANRLTTDQFTGLPLTALCIGMIITVGTLSEVAENLVKSEPMVQIDTAFTGWLFQGRIGQLSTLFYGLTAFGSTYVTIGIGVLASIGFIWNKRWRNLLILWLLMLGVGASVQLGKREFSRPRPPKMAYYAVTGYSFPSGHSATAMTLYGLLGYWWIRQRRSTRSQIWVGVAATTLILLVGFSRIYLGVHYLSDVLGGYLLGICWLIIGITLTEWQHTKPNAAHSLA